MPKLHLLSPRSAYGKILGNVASDYQRVDRWAKEIKGQKEWSHKWGLLNDPKLYGGENAPEVSTNRNPPTKWSGFSVINPPGRHPMPSKPEVPAGYIAPTFKITGERDSHSRKTVRQNAKDTAHSLTDYSTSSSSYGSMYRPQKKETTPVQGTSKHVSKAQVPPAFHQAPFATATPVAQEDIKKLEKNYRASLVMYNSSLVGARAGGKVEFAREPQAVYRHPATSSMEYGWNWAGRKNLEIYGR